jgi:NAD(P)-dependent dehydrogenase (short-subunit alcohol dehydrogenase family)
MDFGNRVAVVTGGVSGIGAATAAILREAGSTVVTWDVDESADIQVDTSSEDQVEAAMSQTRERFGLPTILVASAGIARVGSLLDTSVAEWERVFAVNTKGVWLTYRTVAREIRDAGADGAIVGVSSFQAVLSDPYLAAYSTSKAALLHLSKIAAVEWGMYGVRVNVVGPGSTLTAMSQAMYDSDPSYGDEVAKNTPLGRMGTPELVADGIVNVLRAEWMTGQVIMLDGGASLLSARGWSAAKSRMAIKPDI